MQKIKYIMTKIVSLWFSKKPRVHLLQIYVFILVIVILFILFFVINLPLCTYQMQLIL